LIMIIFVNPFYAFKWCVVPRTTIGDTTRATRVTRTTDAIDTIDTTDAHRERRTDPY